MANNRENIDPSTITDDESAFELFMHSIKAGVVYDAFQGKTRFHAIVLTMPLPLSAVETSNPNDGTTGHGRFKFRGRIIDNPSPHSIYPDPCDPDVASDITAVLKRIKLHTEFYSSENSSAVKPKKNDIVIVELKPNVFSYNLMEGEYVGLVDKSSASSQGYTTGDCSASSAFGGVFALAGDFGPGQKGVYLPTGLPITNGTLSGFGLIAGATQGYLNGHPRILKDVVSEWDSMAAAFAANFSAKGWKLAGSGDRTYATQVKLKAEKGRLAATPGTSNHGWGLAVDTHYYDGSGEKKSLSFDGEAYKWLFTNASKYNWENPYWAQNPDKSAELGKPCVPPAGKRCGSKKEVWHWESTRRNSLVQKGTTVYNEAVAAAAPQDPPPEAGDGTTEPGTA